MRQISISFTIPEFKAMLREAVQVEMQLIRNRLSKSNEPKIYSRKQAADILEVSLSTLHLWNKDEILKAYKTGGRVYYKRTDVEKLVNPK